MTIEERKRSSRALLHKLYSTGYTVTLLPNNSIRVEDEHGDKPPEKLQRVVMDFRFELRSLVMPSVAEEDKLWEKAWEGICEIFSESGLKEMPDKVREELWYAQDHWERDDVGGSRYHLMRAFIAARMAVDQQTTQGG
jgi:hypothetical protein